MYASFFLMHLSLNVSMLVALFKLKLTRAFIMKNLQFIPHSYGVPRGFIVFLWREQHRRAACAECGRCGVNTRHKSTKSLWFYCSGASFNSSVHFTSASPSSAVSPPFEKCIKKNPFPIRPSGSGHFNKLREHSRAIKQSSESCWCRPPWGRFRLKHDE